MAALALAKGAGTPKPGAAVLMAEAGRPMSSQMGCHCKGGLAPLGGLLAPPLSYPGGSHRHGPSTGTAKPPLNKHDLPDTGMGCGV